VRKILYVIRDVFCAGLDPKMIAKALAERGLLVKGEDGKTSRLVRINGETTRVYVLAAKAWIEGNHNHGG
jgi:hypothetical protein